MKTFVIAMDSEAQCVVSQMAHLREETLHGRRIVRGELGGEEAVVVVAGVGKANAAAAAMLAIGLWDSKRIVNIGLCGGFEPGMKAGEIYEVSDAVQYDFDLCQVNGLEIGTLNERKTPFIPCTATGLFPRRRLGTGDRFNDRDDDLGLLRRLGICLRDMEGAAIAQVCEAAGVEFVSWKCVSDVHGLGSMSRQYLQNQGRCLAILTDVVESRIGAIA